MGICTRRYFLLTICTLQLVSTIERQVFDFLGYMWAPILANFFHIIFVIFGFFGAFQYRPRYLITYTVWNILWIGWNIFIICFYLDIGLLDKDSDILNLGTGSISWWEVNGAGCKPVYPTNLTAEDTDVFRPLRPEHVPGCFLDYEYVEILHASVQCLLAVLGIIGGIFVSYILCEDDDSFDFLGAFENKSPQHLALRPMYVSPDYEPVPVHYLQHPSTLSWQIMHKKSKNILQQGPDRIRVSRSLTSVNNKNTDLKKSTEKLRPKSVHVPIHSSGY